MGRKQPSPAGWFLAITLFCCTRLARQVEGKRGGGTGRIRPPLFRGPCGETYLNDPEVIPDAYNVRAWFGGGVQHFAPKQPCTPEQCWQPLTACEPVTHGGPLKVYVTPAWALGHSFPTATQQAGLQLLGGGSGGGSRGGSGGNGTCDVSPLFECVATPEEACVVIVAGHIPGAERGAIARLADTVGGRNVVVLNPGHWTEPLVGHGDWPGLPFDTGRAALAMSAFLNGTYRLGFDIQLPCIPYPGFGADGSLLRFTPEEVAAADERGRDVLLSFKGAANMAIQTPWYVHRNILGNLNDPERGVVVDLQCGDGSGQQWTVGADYQELLLRSRFGAAPGGGGPSSYRLWETLAAGAVPVIFGSTVAPFSGAADESELGIRWDRCVVHVWGVEEIAGLPERLRAMPATEYLRRRAACRSIFRRVLGTRGAYQRAFFTLLRARARGATAAASG